MRNKMRSVPAVTNLSPAAAAMIGNTNAAKPNGEAKAAFVAIRCRRADKTAWVQAANKAHRAGKLPEDGRAKSVLAAWVIMNLNRAADRENTPEESARRRAVEAAAKHQG